MLDTEKTKCYPFNLPQYRLPQDLRSKRHTARTSLPEQDQEQLLRGVKDLNVHYPLNYMTVYGNSAQPIVAAMFNNQDANILLPVVVAGRYKAGKIIGLYHVKMLSPTAVYSRKFLLNCIQWVGCANVGCKIALFSTTNVLLRKLLDDSSVSYDDLNLDEIKSLNPQLHTVIVIDFELQGAHIPHLLKYMENGGGIIIANTLLDRVYGHYGTKYLANKLSQHVGFVWGNSRSLHTGFPVRMDTQTDVLKDMNVLNCWEKVKHEYNNRAFLSNVANEIHQCTATIAEGLQHIPKGDSYFSDVFYTESQQFVNNVEHPVKMPILKNDRAASFQLYVFHALSAYVLKPEDIILHNSSKTFPGEIQTKKLKSNDKIVVSLFQHEFALNPQTNAIRSDLIPLFEKSLDLTDIYFQNSSKKQPTTVINSTVFAHPKLINSKLLRNSGSSVWNFTGLYAPPARVIEVKIINGQGISKFLSIQVGSTVFDPGFFQEKLRSPKVTSEFYFEGDTARISNPWGGLIYVKIPVHLTYKTLPLDDISLSIQGAIQAPHYVLGKTRNNWESELQATSSPWVEFEGQLISFSMRVTDANKIKEFEQIVLWYDIVLKTIAELLNESFMGYRKHRISFDYSDNIYDCYPQMFDFSFLPTFTDVTSQTHIMEVTYAISAFYNMDKIMWRNTHSAFYNVITFYVLQILFRLLFEQISPETSSNAQQAAISQYKSNGASYTDWEDQTQLQIYTFMHLQKIFGWAFMTRIFTSLDNVDINLLPKTTEEKRNFFVISSSKASGFNLAEHFRGWGWPVSDDTEDEINHLPLSNIIIKSITQIIKLVPCFQSKCASTN